MTLIKFITHEGNEYEANVNVGDTIMNAAIDNGIDGIVAECGGACSCATCHCYIDEAWQDKLSPAEGMESEMLECAVDPKPNSRLSCQITMTEALDGIVVHLPASQ